MTRHNRALPAAIVLVVPVVFVACGPLQAPPAVGPEARTQSAPPPPVPTGGTLAEQRKGYLAAVYATLRPRWDQVREKATVMLPPDHPANQLSRATGLSARLDRQGKILSVAVVKGSGHEPFDASARAALRHIRVMPGLPPALRKGHVELRWTLYRDARSCAVEHASLVLHPLSEEESFGDALRAGALDSAYDILARSAARARLLEMLARRGLAAREDPLAWRRALVVAPRSLLVSLLSTESGKRGWGAVVRQLVARKDAVALTAELERVSAEADGAGKVRRVLALVQGLAQIEARAPDAVMAPLLKSADTRVVRVAASGAWSAADLDAAMARHAKQPGVAGVLAVFRLALGASPAATRVLEAAWQNNKHRQALLGAMARRPSEAMTARVEALVRSTANPPAVRIKAIKVLAGLKGKASPFYVALLSKREDVRLAAIEALGQRKESATSVSYRLSVVAKWGGKVGAAAVRTAARFGDPRFLGSIAYLLKAQPRKLRPSIVAEMWRFGPKAVLFLKGKLGAKDPAMQRAATASLARIKSPAAAKALAEYRKEHPAPPAAKKKPESKLAKLLGRVMELVAQKRGKGKGKG